MNKDFTIPNIDQRDLSEFIKYNHVLEQYTNFSFYNAEDIEGFYRRNTKAFMDRFNVINYIDEHGEEMSQEEWEFIYENYKHDSVISIYLTENLLTPLNIVEKLILDTDIIGKNITNALAQKEGDKQQIIYALQRKLPDDLLSKISNILNMDFYSKIKNKLSHISEPQTFQLTPKAYTIICQSILDLIQNNRIKYFELSDYDQRVINTFFKYNNDKDFLIDLIKQDIDAPFLVEDFRSAIINNSIFDLENNEEDIQLLNKLFNNGADISVITHFTPYIAKNICLPFFETFKIIDDSKNGVLPFKTKTIETTLLKLIDFAEKGLLSAEIEYDIVKRHIVHDPHRFRFKKGGIETLRKKLPKTILANTTNPAVMKEIDNLPTIEMHEALSLNKNLTEDIVTSYRDTFFKKLYKAKDPQDFISIPYTLIRALGNFSEINAFLPEQYNFIFEHIELKELYRRIVLSPQTPTNVLENISKSIKPPSYVTLDEYNPLPDILSSKFHLFCRNNDIDITKAPAQNILFYLSSQTNHSVELMLKQSIDEIKKATETNKYHFYSHFDDEDITELINDEKHSDLYVENALKILAAFSQNSSLTKDELHLINDLTLRITTLKSTKDEYDKDYKNHFINASTRSMLLKAENGFSIGYDIIDPQCYKSIKAELLSIINVATYLHSHNIDFDYVPVSLKEQKIEQENFQEK